MSERKITSLVERLSHTRPFDYNYPGRVGDDVSGLYSFWLRGCCLYVGMSIDIRRRLIDHRMNEENPKLAGYVRAFHGEIEASFVPLEGITKTMLHDIEKRVIRSMRPQTNVSGNVRQA